MEPKHSCVYTEISPLLYKQFYTLILFSFKTSPVCSSSTSSILQPSQVSQSCLCVQIQNIQSCFCSLSVKPSALICCCAKCHSNIKRIYLFRATPFYSSIGDFFFAWYKFQSTQINHDINSIFKRSKVTAYMEAYMVLGTTAMQRCLCVSSMFFFFFVCLFITQKVQFHPHGFVWV